MIASARIPWILDRAPNALIVLILVGSCLAFGGSVWWARPFLTACCVLLVLAAAARASARRSWSLLKSPLPLLGVLSLAVAILQLVPLPPALASRISPAAHRLYTTGALWESAPSETTLHVDSDGVGPRTPASVDRSATLRWLVWAGACLVVFVVVAQDSDRLDRTLIIWGSVIACLFLLTGFGIVQLIGGSADRLYGVYSIGSGPSWTPSLQDQLSVPTAVELHEVPASARGGSVAIVPRPVVPDMIGGLLGGPGAYLALGSLALPLSLGLVIHTLAPRGSRATLGERLFCSNRGGIAGLLLLLTLLGAGLMGYLAGSLLSIPLVLGLLAAALPGARSAAVGCVAVLVLAAALLSLGVGAYLGDTLGRPRGLSELTTHDGLTAAMALWRETAHIARDFPLVGSGLGSFPQIHPYYKSTYLATTTAWSSLLRFWSEGGLAGVLLLGCALAWSVVRLPSAWRRVGTADRVLASALIGSMLGFAGFSLIHWTVEVPAISLAACAVAGTLDRWLAGGTDLFVPRG